MIEKSSTMPNFKQYNFFEQLFGFRDVISHFATSIVIVYLNDYPPYRIRKIYALWKLSSFCSHVICVANLFWVIQSTLVFRLPFFILKLNKICTNKTNKSVDGAHSNRDTERILESILEIYYSLIRKSMK